MRFEYNCILGLNRAKLKVDIFISAYYEVYSFPFETAPHKSVEDVTVKIKLQFEFNLRGANNSQDFNIYQTLFVFLKLDVNNCSNTLASINDTT